LPLGSKVMASVISAKDKDRVMLAFMASMIQVGRASPNISLVPQRCLGHVSLTHRGWHKILWCNERGFSGRKLSLHQPLTLSRVSFFFPIRWKSKKVLEQVSPYLNHLAVERWLLRSIEAWKTSTSFPYDLDKMSHTCSLVGSRWSYSSANWIFFACTLTYAPLRQRLSFTNLVLQANTLLVATSIQGAHSELFKGLGNSPSQACSISAPPFSSLSREESK
jgi:hypothetical protein